MFSASSTFSTELSIFAVVSLAPALTGRSSMYDVVLPRYSTFDHSYMTAASCPCEDLSNVTVWDEVRGHFEGSGSIRIVNTIDVRGGVRPHS